MNKVDALRESLLREAVDAVCAEPIPDEVVERSVTQALQLAAPFVRTVQSPRPHQRLWLARPRQWLVCALGAAAMPLVAIVVWNHATSSLLADVVKAIAKKPWMRATGKGGNDVDIELWYSPRHGIFAVRQGTQRLFVNVRQETLEVYTEEEAWNPFLSRLPIKKEQQNLFASQERTLEMLFFGDPTKAFQDRPNELVSHTQNTVRDGDDTFIEHSFTTKVEREDQRMVTVFRVDAESRLPVSWKSMIGETPVFSARLLPFSEPSRHRREGV